MHKIMLLIILLLPSPVLADQTYRVFDKDQNVVEIWKEKNGLIEVYNPDFSRKGYIRQEGEGLERYDKSWDKEGAAESDRPLLPRIQPKDGPIP